MANFLITPPDYYEDRLMVVLAEVEAHPGYWTAALCRYLNGLTQNWQECPPPTPQWDSAYHPPTAADQEHVLAQVRYCGRCADYVNRRKRYRAAQLPDPLPGLEADAAFQIHAPCLTYRLRQLQTMLARLARADMVRAEPGAKIPDPCQPRGWDYATRWYPS